MSDLVRNPEDQFSHDEAHIEIDDHSSGKNIMDGLTVNGKMTLFSAMKTRQTINKP